MLCMVVAVIPMSGAVGDQTTNNANGVNPASGLQVGVTGAEIKEAQSVISNN